MEFEKRKVSTADTFRAFISKCKSNPLTKKKIVVAKDSSYPYEKSEDAYDTFQVSMNNFVSPDREYVIFQKSISWNVIPFFWVKIGWGIRKKSQKYKILTFLIKR